MLIDCVNFPGANVLNETETGITTVVYSHICVTFIIFVGTRLFIYPSIVQQIKPNRAHLLQYSTVFSVKYS